MFCAKRDEVEEKVKKKKLHKEFYSLYFSSYTVKINGWWWIGQDINIYKILARKLEGKTPLERPKYGWDDCVQISKRREEMDWIHLAQDVGPSERLLRM